MKKNDNILVDAALVVVIQGFVPPRIPSSPGTTQNKTYCPPLLEALKTAPPKAANRDQSNSRPS